MVTHNSESDSEGTVGEAGVDVTSNGTELSCTSLSGGCAGDV